MNEEAKDAFKKMNQDFFDRNIEEVVWSKENNRLIVKMKNKYKYEFTGDIAMQIYKKLSY